MMKGLAKLGQMASRLNRPCPQMGVRQGHKWALSHPAFPVLSVMHHLGENELLLLPRLFGLIRWLASSNVFGAGQP